MSRRIKHHPSADLPQNLFFVFKSKFEFLQYISARWKVGKDEEKRRASVRTQACHWDDAHYIN
jgi:hypothetical protein